jgi:hypothetical protein
MELLLWLEETRLALFVRESPSILAYPTILFLHTLGLATVAGLSTFLNLRVLGFARALPFAAMTPFITAAWVASSAIRWPTDHRCPARRTCSRPCRCSSGWGRQRPDA